MLIPLIILMSMIVGQVWLILIQPGYLFDFIGPYIDRLPRKVGKLFTCATCMAGQISLWSYWPIGWWYGVEYGVVPHFCTVMVTIWLTYILTDKLIKL